MISWIIDWMPWWGWAIIVGLPLLFTFQIWSPLAITIWKALPDWARWGLIGVTGGLLAYLAGRNKGRRNAAEEQRRKDAAAIKARLESNQKVERMSPAAKKKELDKWLRD